MFYVHKGNKHYMLFKLSCFLQTYIPSLLAVLPHVVVDPFPGYTNGCYIYRHFATGAISQSLRALTYTDVLK